EHAIVAEELAAVSAAYAVSVNVSGLPQSVLTQFGSEEQKKRYIPPLASGQAIGAFALSEPGSGSDAGNLRTTARKDGDDYVLSGTKFWITQGDVAETIIVMARTGEPGPKGISAFIVERGMKGLGYGKREKKMAMHVSHTMELVLTDLRVPKRN